MISSATGFTTLSSRLTPIYASSSSPCFFFVCKIARSLPDTPHQYECIRTPEDGVVALDWVADEDCYLSADSPVVILISLGNIVILILVPYGLWTLQLGPNKSHLITTNPLFVHSIHNKWIAYYTISHALWIAYYTSSGCRNYMDGDTYCIYSA